MANLTFGSDAQCRMAANSADLGPLVRQNPALVWDGRLVSVSAAAEPEIVPTIQRLVRLQGATSVHFLPKDEAPALIADLEALGLTVALYYQAEGSERSYAKSQSLLSAMKLPEAYRTNWVGSNTPADIVAQIGNLAVSAGVVPACETAMRGGGPRSAVLGLEDLAGRIVACGMSFLGYSVDSPHGTVAFWGMLATAPDQRGRDLAKFVGAALIVQMWEEFGARGFITGIAPDNAASLKTCAAVEVIPRDRSILVVSDPDLFGTGSFTR